MDVRRQFLQRDVLQQFGMALQYRQIPLHAAVALEEARETLFRFGGVAHEYFPHEIAEGQRSGAKRLEFSLGDTVQFAGYDGLDRNGRHGIVVVAPHVEYGLARIAEPDCLLSPEGRDISPQNPFLQYIEVIIEPAFFNYMAILVELDRLHTFHEIMRSLDIQVILIRYNILETVHGAKLRQKSKPQNSHL